ncbi:hypothetical protein ASF10_14095 [Flavobacterium sp. Leaf82]|uniref:hypothetical protein n=1 Tax=Flavobacterium sp. Leaf82 TaxID=1736238 RepID=UPI0006FDBD9D|nr:hypothetical protein [Flavobacterium sp. Leaf82]KQO21246.1 hypothetical protein ASF10_14095 [Flavobacterium sp. Leaf82]
MDSTTKNKIGEFICGDDKTKYPVYRSSFFLTRFFQEIGINATHDGSSRNKWSQNVISNLNGTDLQKVILRLVSPKLYGGDREQIRLAILTMNEILAVESLKVMIENIEPKLIKQDPNYNFSEKTEEKEERELKPLPPPNFDKLNLEFGLAEILQKRWIEVESCIKVNATVSAVIMMGSMLEGFLLGIMQKKPQLVNQAKSAPRKDEKVKNFSEWSLNDMIDVAHEVGWIQLDVKKFSHALKDFRNIIHPYQQLVLKTNPDIDTCNISWLVVQATFNDIADWLNKNDK